MNLPNKIWVVEENNPWNPVRQGIWDDEQDGQTGETEYIRADLVDSTVKEVYETLKTALDYAQDASNGSLWYESYKQGSKALVQIDPEMGQGDFERFNSALKKCKSLLE